MGVYLRSAILVALMIAAALATSLAAAAANPASLAYRFTPSTASVDYGTSLAIGDMNGDGYDDLLVGSFGGDPLFPGAQIYRYSGINGAETLIDVPYETDRAPRDLAMVRTSPGEADAILVGDTRYRAGPLVQPQGRAYLLSKDGDILAVLESPSPRDTGLFGWHVAACDTTGDGVDELIVTDNDYVFVFDLQGFLLWSPPISWSEPMLACGDLNGDGVEDIVVGGRFEDINGFANQGRVNAYSGATHELIHSLTSPQLIADPTDGALSFGAYVALGDANGDGRPDIGVSSPGEGEGEGAVYVFDGQTASPLLHVVPPSIGRSEHGRSMALGDWNGDGRADVFASDLAGSTADGQVYVHSGVDGSLLAQIANPLPTPGEPERFGQYLAVGDVTGDGNADVATSARQENSPRTQDAFVFTAQPDFQPASVGGNVTLTTSPSTNHTSTPYALAALIPAFAAGLWLAWRMNPRLRQLLN